MAEFKRTGQKKQEEAAQKRRARQKDSNPLSDKNHSWDQDELSIGETPFSPKIEKHAELLARTNSSDAVHKLVMQLHKTYGNRYLQRLLNSKVLQAKLTVSNPGDVYEREADRVAQMITRSGDTQLRRQAEEEEEIQMQPADEEKEIQAQRQAEEEEPVQAKATPEMQRQELPEEELQAQLTENQAATVRQSLETRINNKRGNGHPLSDNVREPMEQAFRTDFSEVRVHTDSEADALNQQLSAKAFTTGQDVFFREGEYSPGSSSGRALIAHELTHVVQQRGGQLHGDVQSQTETELTCNLSKSPSDVIQRNNDLLNPDVWQAESGSKGKKRAKKLKAIDEAVSEYHSLKGEAVDRRIAALDKISKAIADWKSSTWFAEKRKSWEWIKKLRDQVGEAFRIAHIEKKQVEEAAKKVGSVNEILGDVNKGLAKDALTKAVFDNFIKWCRDKNVKYKTGSAVNILVAGKGPSYCKPLSEALKEVFGAVGIDAIVDKISQEWFTTKPLPNFIDQTTSGNLKDSGSGYGAGGRRFFFSEHWVVKVNGTVYDPTSGEVGDPAAKIVTSGFAKEKRTINSKEEEVYVKGAAWIRALPGQVDCSAFGYELHSG